jgi:hypothetical protein
MAVTGGKTLTIFLAADLKKFNQGMTQAQTGLKGFASTMSNMLGPAAIGAGIAIAGLATKMAVDGVKAAAEDEVSLAKLTQTLENLKLAHSTQEIDTFIDALEQSVGYLGDLRPAYDRLIRSTKDAAEANSLLSLSLDVAAGTGKSVEAVAEALGKAYDGNTGALGRLGAGIDRATIASGDMNKITGVLAETFGGQATAQADTLNGRMQQLQRASEQLTEAFGKGLLTSVRDATNETADMVKTMEKLEPVLEDLGETLANLGGSFVDFVGFIKSTDDALADARTSNGLFGVALNALYKQLNPLAPALDIINMGLDFFTGAADEAAEATGYTAVEARKAVPQWNSLTGAIRMTTQQYIDYLNANAVGNGILKDANKNYQDLAARQKQVNTFTYEYTGVQTEATQATSGAASAVEKLTKREKELTDLHETKSANLDDNRTKLSFYTAELQKATDAIESFTSGMQANLLAGIDLGSIYKGQFNEQGEKTGESILEGFNAAVAQAEWFGNVLNAIKEKGADTQLIEQIAGLGPEVGGALAQQMLDEGLVPTLSDKFVAVQEKTRELAMGLVPEFLIAGQESALTMVDSISEQMAKEVNRLAKIGKQIAKPLGQSFKAQLMSDVAAALLAVEAAGAAGRAEAVAKAEQRQVQLTNTAVAQALQNLVSSADARNGAPRSPVNK